MRKQFDHARGFNWVDGRLTVDEVRAETQGKFAPLRDEQLKALMLQVQAISEATGVPLLPAFTAALDARGKIMADHARRKEAL